MAHPLTAKDQVLDDRKISACLRAFLLQLLADETPDLNHECEAGKYQTTYQRVGMRECA